LAEPEVAAHGVGLALALLVAALALLLRGVARVCGVEAGAGEVGGVGLRRDAVGVGEHLADGVEHEHGVDDPDPGGEVRAALVYEGVAAGARPFAEDQLAHEETAQHEEQVDAGPAEHVAGPLQGVEDRIAARVTAEVPAQRQDDRDAADDVQIESPGARARAALRWQGVRQRRGRRGRH